MLDTFIKNKGITKTIIHNKNKNYYNEIEWNADYDGENANLSLNVDDNGVKEHMNMKMNNNELAELLNIPSEKNMLDQRLYSDFLSRRPNIEYKIIEIPKEYNIPKSILYKYQKPKDSCTCEKNKKKVHFEIKNQPFLPLENEIDDKFYTHVSSPSSEEELLIPLIVDDNKTRKHRKHKKQKQHVTHKDYKKNRLSSLSPISSRKTLKRAYNYGHRSRRTF
jgi:hypothetical protein